MTLNALKRTVAAFEQKAGFDATDARRLLEMVDEEVAILKAHLDKKEIVDHEIMDVQVLLLQLANRYGTDLDLEWTAHFKKSEKYLT